MTEDNRKIALTLMYDGKDFCGWQVQKNAPSVQKAVQDALEKVFVPTFPAVQERIPVSMQICMFVIWMQNTLRCRRNRL